MSLAKRVIARFLQKADLNPPLGYPGGPCHVVERIQDQVRSPKLKEDLSTEVETGHKLSNPDAAKVYHIETERGVGMFQRLLISAHAQYRMDLRSVTVPAVRVALQSFNKLLMNLKSQQSPALERITRELQQGTYEWVDPKMQLAIVLAMESRDTVKLVTTYWKGDSDPRPPGSCDLPKS